MIGALEASSTITKVSLSSAMQPGSLINYHYFKIPIARGFGKIRAAWGKVGVQPTA